MATLPKITIGGVDVTSYYLSFYTEDSIDTETSVASIKFINSVQSAITLTEQMEIVITEGYTTNTDNTIFRGIVSNIAKGGEIIDLTAQDKIWLLQRKTFKTTYNSDVDAFAGKISSIAEDIIQTFGGLTASVVDSGTVNILKRFRSKDDTCYERLKRLAEIIGYQIYYNPATDTIHFEPTGNTLYTGGTLVVGTHITTVPQWIYDREDMANLIKVKGAFQEVETTETGQIGVTSGYTVTDILLTQEPVSVKVFADSSDPPTTLRTGGVVGSTSSFDYSVDKQNKNIDWSSTYTPGASDYVIVQYSYKEPRTVTVSDDASIDAYGAYEITKKYKDVEDLDDAKEKAKNLLTLKPVPTVRSKFSVTGVSGVTAGMKITVEDGLNNENRTIIVRKVKKKYPLGIDEYDVGDLDYNDRKALINMNERLRVLEKEEEQNQGLNVEIKTKNHDITFERRYKKQKNYKIFDSFSVGHYVNGLLGQGQILDNFESSNSGNWSGTGITIGDEAVTVQVGAGSMSVAWTQSSGAATFLSTQSLGDLSTETGAASGTPAKGTIGVWWNSANTTDITALKIRIGSSASDYIECSAREYRTVDGYINWGSLAFGLYAGQNYYMFDLDNPDTSAGTPDWTAVDYVRFELTVAAASSATMDYLTISKSNYIGLNGLGDRSILIKTAFIMPENRIWKEYLFDTEFLAAASTAAIDTTNQRILF